MVVKGFENAIEIVKNCMVLHVIEGSGGRNYEKLTMLKGFELMLKLGLKHCILDRSEPSRAQKGQRGAQHGVKNKWF